MSWQWHAALKACLQCDTWSMLIVGVWCVLCSSSRSFERTRHPLPSISPTMPRSAVSATACPDIPEGVDLPPDYVAKQCRRCGVWSVARARYDQSKGKEAAWGILVAWGRGCLTGPVGCHCLICKKAWDCLSSCGQPVVYCYLCTKPHIRHVSCSI